jgi:phosphomannomutase/phosphoglucomutase
MKINPNIFRAYDIRGIYPQEINEEVVYKIGLAFSNLFKNIKEAVIARDYRLSSPTLKGALLRGLQDGGKDIVDLGTVPVPVFYFGILHYKKGGGLMVTASHLGKEYNGLKIQKEKAIPIVGETGIYKMRDMILKNKLTKAIKEVKIIKKNIVPDYINYLSSKIKLARPLKIILDTSNGACGDIPEKIFQKLGCNIFTLYREPDGNFPNHPPDPHNPESLKDLQKEVVEKKADFGLLYDGDGDRIGLVDEKGRVISADFILMMLARQALSRKKGNIVYEIRVSKALFEDVENHGGKVFISKIGHAYVLLEILKRKAIFGGEFTGHLYFNYCYYPYDDGIFTGLKLAEIISQLPKLSNYIDSLPRYCASPEIFINSTDEEKFKLIEGLQKHLKEDHYDFIDIDGARINFDKGWALMRASNTAPLLKCRFEGNTKDDLIEIEKKSLEIFRKVGIPVTKKVYQELGLEL